TGRSPEQIGKLHSYCIGGDFSEECGQPVGWIWPPPPPGLDYLNVTEGIVVADEWSVTGTDIKIVADVGGLVSTPGVYTFQLLRDIGSDTDVELLVQLSSRVE
ncbi:MAG: hypothetical protein IIB27_04575, partial [Chloroflexi bacterium]|nr:hypothetical protein [Chloroflexota bacterium]